MIFFIHVGYWLLLLGSSCLVQISFHKDSKKRKFLLLVLWGSLHNIGSRHILYSKEVRKYRQYGIDLQKDRKYLRFLWFGIFSGNIAVIFAYISQEQPESRCYLWLNCVHHLQFVNRIANQSIAAKLTTFFKHVNLHFFPS